MKFPNEISQYLFRARDISSREARRNSLNAILLSDERH